MPSDNHLPPTMGKITLKAAAKQALVAVGAMVGLAIFMTAALSVAIWLIRAGYPGLVVFEVVLVLFVVLTGSRYIHDRI